eukprot:4444602-Amphidinium_carterae.1
MMPSVRVSTIIMIEMMSSLGGTALMSRNLIAATETKKTVGVQLTPDEVEEGFNFIRSSGPASGGLTEMGPTTGGRFSLSAYGLELGVDPTCAR